MNFNTDKISRAGYYIGIVMVVILLTSALSKYILPESLWLAIFTPLYGADYVAAQLVKFEQNAGQEFIHRIFGSLYLIVGILNFKTTLRVKYRSLHRSIGKFFIVTSVLVGLSGVILSIVMPFSGIMETIPSVIFGTFLVVAAVLGLVFARKGQIKRHQKWMIRCFAVGLGSASVRLLHPMLINIFTDVPQETIFVIVLWASWGLHLGAVELFFKLKREGKGKSRALAISKDDNMLDAA
ncbi:MAG: DUF2306 domain-containing protein [Bacteroidota bacterium]